MYCIGFTTPVVTKGGDFGAVNHPKPFPIQGKSPKEEMTICFTSGATTINTISRFQPTFKTQIAKMYSLGFAIERLASGMDMFRNAVNKLSVCRSSGEGREEGYQETEALLAPVTHPFQRPVGVFIFLIHILSIIIY